MYFKSAVNPVLGLPRFVKRGIAVSIDAIFCGLAVWLALYLRLDEWVVLNGWQWLAVAASVAIALPIFAVAGLYRAIFRYAGPAAIPTIANAVLVYGAFYAVLITFVRIESVPRTVGIIQPVLLFLLVGASRILVGWALGGTSVGPKARASRAVMIYGAGHAGRQLARGLAMSEMRVVGFIDDDPMFQNRTMMGKRIYLPVAIEGLVARHQITDILLAIPSASRRRRNEILDLVRRLGVAVRTIPGLSDVAQGRVETSELRELDVEDLLLRDAVSPDEALLRRNVAGNVVLITGAGGSIGSELCRQVVMCDPTTLILVETSEPALYSVHEELVARCAQLDSAITLVPILGSVTDRARMAAILDVWSPQTIYHAAAYKHVPLVEHNPAAGIRNNVYGTMTMALLAMERQVATFVFVSTDKAVRPTNVMGTTKRLAEQVLQAIAATSPVTCFAMVRFGNVLGSSGSVVPLFRRQIGAGGPVTVTDPEMTRYFMTIPEASQLVIQAGAMAAGGEVFVLDMGEPIRIVDLARTMIELSGLTVIDEAGEGDIEISYIGLRPGEKLYEELLIGNNPEPTGHPRIRKANEQFICWPELRSYLRKLEVMLDAQDVKGMSAMLLHLVPEYTPEARLVDLVHLKRVADASSEQMAGREAMPVDVGGSR